MKLFSTKLLLVVSGIILGVAIIAKWQEKKEDYVSQRDCREACYGAQARCQAACQTQEFETDSTGEKCYEKCALQKTSCEEKC